MKKFNCKKDRRARLAKRRRQLVSFQLKLAMAASWTVDLLMLLLYSWFCFYRNYLEKSGRNKQLKRRSHQIETTIKTLCTGQCHFVKLNSYVYRKRSINDPKNVWKLLCRDISPPASLAIFPNTFSVGWMVKFENDSI